MNRSPAAPMEPSTAAFFQLSISHPPRELFLACDCTAGHFARGGIKARTHIGVALLVYCLLCRRPYVEHVHSPVGIDLCYRIVHFSSLCRNQAARARSGRAL